MKYELYGVIDGKGQVVFASDNEEEYMAFVNSLPDEEPEYLEPSNYSPSCPWNAPGMKISDFI